MDQRFSNLSTLNELTLTHCACHIIEYLNVYTHYTLSITQYKKCLNTTDASSGLAFAGNPEQGSSAQRTPAVSKYSAQVTLEAL